MPHPTEAYQLILGPDKRNPSFCLYTDTEEKELHVYYGLELLEVVPNDRDSPAYRLLAARLYNAQVRVGTLEAVFGLDRKTLRRWGLALRSGDREWLAEVLAGRWGRRKFTLEMESYVRSRWAVMRAEGRRDYRRRLVEELERVFGVKVSGETLRSVLRSLREEGKGAAGRGEGLSSTVGASATGASEGGKAEPNGGATPPGGTLGLEGGGGGSGSPGTGEVAGGEGAAAAEGSQVSASSAGALPAVGLGEVSCVLAAKPALALAMSSKSIPLGEDWSAGQTAWCEHAGLLLFGEALEGASRVVEPAEPWLRQALGSVLAGAVNVEQSKYLNVEDLDRLLGLQVRGLGPQRQRLKALAQGPSADRLLRWNSQRVGADQQTDFYLDPHTKHYTGMAAVLKGWCPTIRWADKALHSDFVHTVSGQPVYFECTDNYEDLRTRLWGVLERARAALGWPADHVLSLVIDRAVFGQETFEKVLAEPALHLITWQKGYAGGGWDEGKVSGQCVIERPRNRAADLKTYRFRYLDQPWAADPRWRQLIVQATNPSGRTVEVAILTDDLARPAVEVVRLMFGRWVQENDFKYLDQHFGINQITSYGVVEYGELKGQLTDRQVESGAYRALQEQARQLRGQLGRRLWAQRQAEGRQAARQARMAELEGVVSPPPDPGGEEEVARRRERARLKGAATRHDKSQAARQEQISALEQQWEQLVKQAAQTGQTVSRLEDLIARGMVRLDSGPKRLLDAIKVVARNEFYRALAPFRQAYDNYRDDHEHFRRLTQSAGVLRWNGQVLEVHLLSSVPYGVTLRRVWEKVLAGVNAGKPAWPDGSGRRVWFRLASRSELRVSLGPP